VEHSDADSKGQAAGTGTVMNVCVLPSFPAEPHWFNNTWSSSQRPSVSNVRCKLGAVAWGLYTESICREREALAR
jgi:hypothetical protein